MTTNKSVKVVSPAKLTLSLRIKGRREDGYHFIEAEMVTIDLVDSVFIKEGERKVTYEGVYPINPHAKEDLVLRTLNFLDVDSVVTVSMLHLQVMLQQSLDTLDIRILRKQSSSEQMCHLISKAEEHELEESEKLLNHLPIKKKPSRFSHQKLVAQQRRFIRNGTSWGGLKGKTEMT